MTAVFVVVALACAIGGILCAPLDTGFDVVGFPGFPGVPGFPNPSSNPSVPVFTVDPSNDEFVKLFQNILANTGVGTSQSKSFNYLTTYYGVAPNVAGAFNPEDCENYQRLDKGISNPSLRDASKQYLSIMCRNLILVKFLTRFADVLLYDLTNEYSENV